MSQQFTCRDCERSTSGRCSLHANGAEDTGARPALRQQLREMKCAVHPTIRCSGQIEAQHACKHIVAAPPAKGGRWVNCENCLLYRALAAMLAAEAAPPAGGPQAPAHPEPSADVADLLRRLEEREQTLRRLVDDPYADGTERPDADLLREARARIAQMVQKQTQHGTILKAECDRSWKEETFEQIVSIAASALYWAKRRAEQAEAQVTRQAEVLRSMSTTAAEQLREAEARVWQLEQEQTR